MQIKLRPAIAADAVECGRICYEAFSGIAAHHRFPVDWGSEDVAIKVIEARLAHRLTYGVVAEERGRIIGSAFLKMYRPVGAIGPVTVSPDAQGTQAGRLMMEHLLERARDAGMAGTRLVQAAYNTTSLALYTKLGFQVREMLACLHGKPIAARIRTVSLGDSEDIEACDRLCMRLHGYVRLDDISEALRSGYFSVVRREGRVTGYTTGIHFRGHTIGETNQDVELLIAAAQELPDPGILMPASNGELLRWAIDNGLRITQPLSLMTLGFYQPPAGAFLPSIHA